MSAGPIESVLRRLIRWLDDNAATLARLTADVERYQRNHPKPLAPGMVTWPTRRRRRRRP